MMRATSPFPSYIVKPYPDADHLFWNTDDWDAALRFWALPFDRNLGTWLKSVDDPLRPSILAAREFASQIDTWDDPADSRTRLLANAWLEDDDVKWMPDKAGAEAFIVSEIEMLRQYMQDDRERYLAEIDAQADGLPAYLLAFIGASRERHPWTVELVNCALAISNVAYMRWKFVFKRVRPSFLCPGLVPPFGPPAHPAFPSGHATLAHLAALLLLEIEPLHQRHGIFSPPTRPATPEFGEAVDYTVAGNALGGTTVADSPLLWLADRVAKNRERLGVHYATDSSAGRHLAAGMVKALLHHPAGAGGVRLNCPTLKLVLRQAAAEWAPLTI